MSALAEKKVLGRIHHIHTVVGPRRKRGISIAIRHGRSDLAYSIVDTLGGDGIAAYVAVTHKRINLRLDSGGVCARRRCRLNAKHTRRTSSHQLERWQCSQSDLQIHCATCLTSHTAIV